MLKYIITAAAALLATPAFGQQQDFCGSLGELAGSILTERYAGLAMSQQIAVMNEEIEDVSLRALVRSIILAAYKEPTMANRIQHAASFRNRWEVACYEAEGAMA